ncbi:hypothetical protein [Arthrobacter sp. S41]|uniref:hypothetical protein n=1 Tax=Arthrobacter sp. S41 TaxID=2509721 RepID=UPI0010359451|nr:hypothetical protein [Arthrobacter sp. S41]TAP26869.1 hypothetical protein EYR88_00420 [Arthrobacter sp. S41]
MSSIYDFPKVPSPYPDKTPWYDLSSLTVNGWAGDGRTFVFLAKIEDNQISFYLRTRYGTSNVVVTDLPTELRPPFQLVFNAYLAINESGYSCLFTPDGKVQIWVSGNDYSRVANGSLLNLVVESTYARRV